MNFVRVHQAIKTTPVVKACIAKHKWTIEDIAVTAAVEPGRKAPTKSAEN